ncbi:MAG: DUF4143 domain-containing protein [Methanomicrobiaceae archaeon]|nr:DUF4143 domain-containing protein [Methanomicrobiaceae archaeon]
MTGTQYSMTPRRSTRSRRYGGRQVYMVFELRNFSYSLKKQLISNTKYYAIDTGFVNAVSFSFSQNIGRLYENVVFNELMRRGNTIFFLNEGGTECDFVVQGGDGWEDGAQEGNAVTGAYQVCYDLNEQNMQREVAGLVMASRTFGPSRGFITESTTRTVKEDAVEIRVVPITVFQLGLVDQV